MMRFEQRSEGSVGEGRFHRWTRMKRTQDFDRCDRRPGQFGGDVVCDAGKTKNTKFQHLSCCVRCLQLQSRDLAQPQVEGLARERFPGCFRVTLELIADRGANEVGAVGVELLRDQKINVPEVDKSQIDRDFL